jgi:hypothetical protein
MKPANELTESRTSHTYAPGEGFKAAEYVHQEYPKQTPWGIARDAEHEALMKANHEGTE